MAEKPKSYAETVGDDWKQFAAGGPFDLTDGTNGPQRCARRVVMLAAGDLTACVNAAGTNKPLTGLAAGYVHDGHTQSITPTAACIVYW